MEHNMTVSLYFFFIQTMTIVKVWEYYNYPYMVKLPCNLDSRLAGPVV